MIEFSSKYPEEMSNFEKDKLKSLLILNDSVVPELLERLNPPLSWVSVLQDWGILNSIELQSAWIVENFDNPRAVYDIAGTINRLSPDLGSVLEGRLKNFNHKNSDLKFCWNLIARQIKNKSINQWNPEWFQIMKQLEQGDCSISIIDRLVKVLIPEIFISHKQSIRGNSAFNEKFQKPSELISIQYNSSLEVNVDEFITLWSSKSELEDSKNLLKGLFIALEQSLEEAICAGLESYDKFGTTDLNILSIERNEQNYLQEGFYNLVRITADIWDQIVKKDQRFAFEIVKKWGESKHRLLRRLALYAAANPIIARSYVFKLLKSNSINQLVISGSSVEVYRLIKNRWKDLTKNQKQIIEKRIVQGAKIKSNDIGEKKIIDRCKFDLLGYMNQIGLDLSDKSISVLNELKSRYPIWKLIPEERAGFRIWVEHRKPIIEAPMSLSQIDDGELISTILEWEKKDYFQAHKNWRSFCISNSNSAFLALLKEAQSHAVDVDLWRIFFEVVSIHQNTDTNLKIIENFKNIPEFTFNKIIFFVADWLKNSTESFPEIQTIFELWDFIFNLLPDTNFEVSETDLVVDSENSTSGALVDTLIAIISVNRKIDKCITNEITTRFEKLKNLPNEDGIYSKVSLIKSIGILFNRFPNWVKSQMVPLLDWSNPVAIHCWSTLYVINWIGTPKIFKMVKKSFLESFKQSTINDEDLDLFVKYLVYMFILDESDEEKKPISFTEARTAIRNGGARCLPEFAKILANEMTQTDSEYKIQKWNENLGPIFNKIWPLDYDLQTQDSNRNLVRLLCESGDAFSIVANDIENKPSLQPNTNRFDFSLYSLSQIDENIIEKAPEQVLDIVYKIVGEQPGNTQGLDDLLEQISLKSPELVNSPKYRNLMIFLK